ncbi:WW domain-containing oxidoreductase isoform X1 [Ursus americanus]|uniref:WW domain-containing oxidoreductase isoform X1 n=1 Tax=Ursus americanus TaxID=9643 RepID=UPI001E67DD9C|nr:WW domain-containing oxidoreductase isoform X1 [Ursus americanus]
MGAGTTGPDGGTEALALDAVLGTLLAVLLLLAVKAAAEQLRRRRAGVAVLVVGAGPVGLTAALVAVRTGRVLKLTVQDARARGPLLGRPQQIALDPRSVRFLRPLGVDFDNVEGCWRNGHFFTRVGVFQEHLLSLLERKGQRPGFRLLLGTKFTDDFMRKVVVPDWPKIIVVADGSHGETCSVLGLSPDYVVESCNAYGANATITRLDQRQVPTPEIRAHNLYLDLSAYGIEVTSVAKEAPSLPQAVEQPGFHLKIYGTFRNRYMALACPASDSKVVRFLRHTLSPSIMKTIFHQAFNTYKMDIEPRVRDTAMPRVQCSRKLFEIVLSHRRATAAYIQGEGRVVTVEGEAARVLNFDTGSGVNLGLQGLESLDEFICKIATAVDQSDILEALAAKIRHSKQVAEDFKRNGLLTTVFE